MPPGFEEVGALVFVGGVEEEAVAFQNEALLLFPDATLAKDEKLLTLGEGPGDYRPFFQSQRYEAHGSAYTSSLSQRETSLAW